jgi:copper chaperone
MQKKIYVAGMYDDDTATKVNASVGTVAGVSKCTANASKAQVLVDYDESTSGIDDAINAAIKQAGVDVLG